MFITRVLQISNSMILGFQHKKIYRLTGGSIINILNQLVTGIPGGYRNLPAVRDLDTGNISNCIN